MNNTYGRIETVLKKAQQIGVKALAPHEFNTISVEAEWGLQFIGCSESTLGRRLRELRQMGRVTAQRRVGKTFVEYTLFVKTPVHYSVNGVDLCKTKETRETEALKKLGVTCDFCLHPDYRGCSSPAPELAGQHSGGL